MQSFKVLAATAAFFAIMLSLPALSEDDSLHWLGSYKEALQEAKRTGKPIFLEYRCEP